MIQFLKKWSPAVMVLLTAIGMLVNYTDSNMVNAYLTGFTGWLVVAVDNIFPESRKVNS